MAKRRRRKKSNRGSRAVRRGQVREGKLVIKDTLDDQAAAKQLGEIFSEKDDVLNATDLNESFKYFQAKHNRG